MQTPNVRDVLRFGEAFVFFEVIQDAPKKSLGMNYEGGEKVEGKGEGGNIRSTEVSIDRATADLEFILTIGVD